MTAHKGLRQGDQNFEVGNGNIVKLWLKNNKKLNNTVRKKEKKRKIMGNKT